MNNTIRTVLLWLVIPIMAILIYLQINDTNAPVRKLDFSDVIFFGQGENIKSITITPDKVTGELKKEIIHKDQKVQRFTASFIMQDPLLEMIMAWNIEEFSLENSSTGDFLIQLFTWVIPLGFFVLLWFFFIRQMQAGGNKAMMFGKSKAKMMTANQKKVTFVDVAGCEEAKEELEEIIDFLKEPQKFQRLGGKIPKGVLLMGPPGTGKTLLARATAGEASVPFFSISGSDFVEMFVGVGASRVRDLFEQGKKNAPCIIFIDEIDAVGRHRGAGMGGGHDEREQTLNQLLVEMDGFESNDGVILVAATNRPDVLDPALLRPGRFDRRVVVDLPDVKGRNAILKVHSTKVPLATDVDLESVSRGAPGFSGADLANMVNEAALLAARRGKKMVYRIDFEDAKDKILMGSERRSMMLSDEEKRNTAFHEAGHAIVAALIGEADPIHKVTIIPRGRALGITQQVPIDDRHSYTSTYLKNRLAILMGGRIAEDIFLDQLTSGPSNDIEVATNTARQMVCELGMSEKIGPISFKGDSDQPFMGRDYNRSNPTSEKTAELIDNEIRFLVEEGDQRAREILEKNRDMVTIMAEKLLEVETLHDWQVRQIINREEVTATNPKLSQDSGKHVESGDQDEVADKDRKADSHGLGNALPEPT
ncbi:MAG: ATP-dependent zinc metalloprotease FtsH [Acidobacteriota bacterium]|nr:ATP-dependent zinc metalloprotease FtsH [Acidobacteriota bacterium]